VFINRGDTGSILAAGVTRLSNVEEVVEPISKHLCNLDGTLDEVDGTERGLTILLRVKRVSPSGTKEKILVNIFFFYFVRINTLGFYPYRMS
jgi:hypothetical protein